MLNPNKDRLDYGQILAPPTGYFLDFAVGTTYSLDLDALVGASLALGLSDSVSTNVGGIQMDALFIDEGFGTLDRKSIENAMDILLNLSSTNKLVGIISHREELKENIPQQIKVTKTRAGSVIDVDLGV